MNVNKLITFKGQIVILRHKIRLGLISFNNGGISKSFTIPENYEDGDIVNVQFLNNNPSSDILNISYLSEEDYFGFVIYYNQEKKHGYIQCAYPKMNYSLFFNEKDYKGNHKIVRGLKVKFKIKKNKKYINIIDIRNVLPQEKYKTFLPEFGYFDEDNFVLNKKYDPYYGTISNVVTKDSGFWFAFIKDNSNSLKKDCYIPKHIFERYFDFKPEKGMKFDFSFSQFTDEKGNIKYTLKSISKSKFRVSNSLFANFLSPLPDNIYYAYFNDNKSEIISIHKLNLNSITELINCYKNSNNDTKLKIVDILIEADLKNKKNLDKNTLIKDKIKLLKHAAKNDILKLLEIQKYNYFPFQLSNIKYYNKIKLFLWQDYRVELLENSLISFNDFIKYNYDLSFNQCVSIEKCEIPNYLNEYNCEFFDKHITEENINNFYSTPAKYNYEFHNYDTNNQYFSSVSKYYLDVYIN